MDDWKPINTEPKDGSKIWLCRMVDGIPRDIRAGVSSNLPPTWPTHWRPRYRDQPQT